MEYFTKYLDRNETRNLLDSAREHGGLGKIFAVETFNGRYDEMERLWYKVPVPSRRDLFKNDGLLDPSLKRSMLAAEGRVMPEDNLAKAGLTPADLRRILGNAIERLADEEDLLQQARDLAGRK